jgi:hypothetical protein
VGLFLQQLLIALIIGFIVKLIIELSWKGKGCPSCPFRRTSKKDNLQEKRQKRVKRRKR